MLNLRRCAAARTAHRNPSRHLVGYARGDLAESLLKPSDGSPQRSNLLRSRISGLGFRVFGIDHFQLRFELGNLLAKLGHHGEIGAANLADDAGLEPLDLGLQSIQQNLLGPALRLKRQYLKLELLNLTDKGFSLALGRDHTLPSEVLNEIQALRPAR